MPFHHRPSLLLLLLLLIIAAASAAAPETSLELDPSPPRHAPSRPLPFSPLPSPETAAEPSEDTSDDQINRIIDALIGAGDFGSWAGVISSAVLPLSATLFVPEDDAVSGSAPGSGDPFMLPYHVVPQRLTFPELLQFRTRARLPTLLPGKTVLITNNSRLNFTIDGSPITMPDLYSTATFTVHGVGAIFNYTAYGGDELNAASNPSEQFRSPPADTPAAEEVLSGVVSSGAAPSCLCNEPPVLLMAVCIVLGLKIHWNNFILKA